jgi:hypothetical protein
MALIGYERLKRSTRKCQRFEDYSTVVEDNRRRGSCAGSETAQDVVSGTQENRRCNPETMGCVEERKEQTGRSSVLTKAPEEIRARSWKTVGCED